MNGFLLTGEEARHRSRRRTSNLRLLRPVLGEVVDFSRLGLGIRSSTALNVGQSYSLLVRRGVRVKKMTGRVAWCSLTKSELIATGTTLPVFRAGIEIGYLEPSAWRFLDSEVPPARSVRH